jgi:hypothetical protein
MGLDYQGDRNSRGKKTEIGREIFSFMYISWEITSNLTITSINGLVALVWLIVQVHYMQ